MKSRIVDEIRKRLEGKSYVNLKMKNGEVIQVSEDTNLWSRKKFYSVCVVVLDDNDNVINDIDGQLKDNLEQVAEWILGRTRFSKQSYK